MKRAKETGECSDHKVTCGTELNDPVIAPTAHRHGVDDDDTILHAFNHPIRVEALDAGMTMLVGPDHAGNVYEIGVVATVDGPVVVHAMPARPEYLR